MVFYPQAIIVSSLFLLNVGLSSAGILTWKTACLTIDECREQSQVLAIIGITNFSVGDYPAFGCFYEGDTTYFGRGGTAESMSQSPLAEGGTRVWCKASSQQEIKVPTGSPTTAEPISTVEPTVLSTVDDLNTLEAPTTSPTTDLLASTASPLVKPTSPPTDMQTKNPSKAPSLRPSSKPTNMPTKMPTSEPTKEPSKAPSRRPSSKPTVKPTKMPAFELTKESSKEPSRRPSSKPTVIPTKKPTSQPIPTESSESGIACRNQNMCNQMRNELGFTKKYYVGNFPTKGCYFKDDTAYFGTGGNLEQKSTSLSGGKWRIWCGSSAPTVPNQPRTNMPTKMPTLELTKESSKEPSRRPSLKPTAKPTQMPTSEPTKEPSKEPSRRPSSKPTAIPTKKPTSQPIPTESLESSISMDNEPMPEIKYCIDIEVTTDKFGQETGFYLTSNPEDGTDPKKIIKVDVGSLESEKTYSNQVCVPKGKYTFTIEDTTGGICCSYGKGSYSISIKGDEIISGGRFSKPTVSHDILAGYDPGMSDRDEEWLEAHNTRRQTFHEKHDTEYRPLHWSPELAKDASNWVDKVLPTCKHLRESNVEEGENMSVKTYRSLSNTENPEDVVFRWYDGYTDIQTMTQVMWRATRHVGCSDKFAKKADGSYCYASICRYSRPGNCNMRAYDNWLIPTLLDHTGCGTTCPKEGCH